MEVPLGPTSTRRGEANAREGGGGGRRSRGRSSAARARAASSSRSGQRVKVLSADEGRECRGSREDNLGARRTQISEGLSVWSECERGDDVCSPTRGPPRCVRVLEKRHVQAWSRSDIDRERSSRLLARAAFVRRERESEIDGELLDETCARRRLEKRRETLPRREGFKNTI